MLKKMMNTRQAVKSVEGYNTLSRREQDKIAGESGLLICWIFGPILLLIPLYFLLPEIWFENCLWSDVVLSIAGLFVGLYQVEKNCRPSSGFGSPDRNFQRLTGRSIRPV